MVAASARFGSIPAWDAQVAWIDANEDDLRARYPDEWVVFYHNTVVSHHADFERRLDGVTFAPDDLEWNFILSKYFYAPGKEQP